MDLKQINRDLNQGVLPDCLNFSIKREEQIDWNMVKYNAFYRSYDYFERKFPKGHEHIPGFDKIIEQCIATGSEKTPLQEIMERKEQEISSSDSANFCE